MRLLRRIFRESTRPVRSFVVKSQKIGEVLAVNLRSTIDDTIALIKDPAKGGRKVDYSRYKYLGKEVPDLDSPGYDNPVEGMRIADEILEDYKAGKISYRTAMSRLNLLELITKKNSRLSPREKAQVRRYVDGVREELKAIRYAREDGV